MPSTLPSWNLKDLLRNPTKDSQRIEKELETRITALERQRSRLTSGISHQAFQRVLKQVEGLDEIFRK